MVGKTDYQAEKEVRERRLMAYAEAIQKRTQEKSSQIIKELVEERQSSGESSGVSHPYENLTIFIELII